MPEKQRARIFILGIITLLLGSEVVLAQLAVFKKQAYRVTKVGVPIESSFVAVRLRTLPLSG